MDSRKVHVVPFAHMLRLISRLSKLGSDLADDWWCRDHRTHRFKPEAAASLQQLGRAMQNRLPQATVLLRWCGP
jgi:hypothetical protein